jgi:hypothetical protein
MDLAWLLRGVSPKPKSHARERDTQENTEGEVQQRCSPSQVEALLKEMLRKNSSYGSVHMILNGAIAMLCSSE